jgi:cytoskeletal protein CcmA (bactofilin family)
MSSTEHTMPDANRLYIGEGVTIKGEISVPDTLVVCGVLEGDVSVGNLVVGETGAIKGRITVAENAEISGKVFEKLDVKCLLILRSTGRVDGNISYGLLQIEQGEASHRRAFFHRLSAGAAEGAGARSVPARSEVAKAGEFSRRKAGRVVDSGAAADAGYVSRRPVNSFPRRPAGSL